MIGVVLCGNDKRYPNKIRKRGHVTALKWHRFTTDPVKRKEWINVIGRGRANLNLENGHRYGQIIRGQQTMQLVQIRIQLCV